MKYEPGDRILVLLTNEEGKVVEILNERMVMIEVKGVKFPAYTDQIDFPYFKMFSEKKTAVPKKKYIDSIKPEKKNIQSLPPKDGGVSLSFLPVFERDIFDDDVVEKLKLHLINEGNTAYHFTYQLVLAGQVDFTLSNTIHPHADFYIHDVDFENLSDNPRFEFEFSLVEPERKKADYYETSLKIKAKQLFKRIEEIQLKNEPAFSYPLFDHYPDRVEEEKVDLGKLGNAGFRVYDASKAKQHLAPPQSVVDLHIEKLTDNWKHLSNHEILNLQIRIFEKFYELSVLHHQPSLTVIHGIGTGRLRDEIHEILRLKKEVKSFVNQYHHLYGYGATEIHFQYR